MSAAYSEKALALERSAYLDRWDKVNVSFGELMRKRGRLFLCCTLQTALSCWRSILILEVRRGGPLVLHLFCPKDLFTRSTHKYGDSREVMIGFPMCLLEATGFCSLLSDHRSPIVYCSVLTTEDFFPKAACNNIFPNHCHYREDKR